MRIVLGSNSVVYPRHMSEGDTAAVDTHRPQGI